jgi:branched-chain amino acid aminotransferase
VITEKDTVWYDGRLVGADEANTSVMSHSLHYASSAFEGIRVYDGVPFKCAEHLARLASSAAILGYELPFSVAEMQRAVADVVVRNGLRDAYVRPVVWRGEESVGVRGERSTVHVAIAAWNWPSPFSPEQVERGISVQVTRWRRPSPESAPTQAKCANLYTIGTLAALEASQSGFDDALFLSHRGFVADLTGANIFLVIDGELHTPDCDSFLAGITRQTILDGAAGLGLKTHVRDIDVAELEAASEVFVCGTAYEILPVARINQTTYPSPVTAARLRDWYLSLTRVKAMA